MVVISVALLSLIVISVSCLFVYLLSIVICLSLSGLPLDCQRRRDNDDVTYSNAYIVDPDGKYSEEPFIAHCLMTTEPPVGITVSSLSLLIFPVILLINFRQ